MNDNELIRDDKGKLAINISTAVQMLGAALIAILLSTAQGIKNDVKQLQLDVAQIRIDMQKVTYHETRIARIEERIDRLKTPLQ